MLWVGVMLFFLSSCVATICMTICQSKLFLPLRDYLKESNKFLHGLISCTYCTSHWVSAFVCLIWVSKQEFPNPVLSWALLTLSMITLASGFQILIKKGHG